MDHSGSSSGSGRLGWGGGPVRKREDRVASSRVHPSPSNPLLTVPPTDCDRRSSYTLPYLPLCYFDLPTRRQAYYYFISSLPSFPICCITTAPDLAAPPGFLGRSVFLELYT